ncbi:amylo-alpha-1,6-glucosidase [Dactylosporangium siamense]|uniref:Glycoside hydrolase family 37 n=1 Tax=Dactylosporangium siamense TaxID=685454 RepID=A0A919PQ19_9ACTN|nr:glycogen debranching protein [Dactylosporangium siamense]GIG47974.1 glycoside hydrolase family 37 [Dactylosporangium siamense]
MRVDLHRVPFSRRGSYFALSRRDATAERPGGLYLRTVRGHAGVRELLLIELLVDGQPVQETAELHPESLALTGAAGARVELAFDDDGSVVATGHGAALRLTGLISNPYDHVVPNGTDSARYIACGAGLDLTITRHAGAFDVDRVWNGSRHTRIAFVARPAADGPFVIRIGGTRHPDPAGGLFATVKAGARADFAAWRAATPEVPDRYHDAAQLADYVTWSSVVAPAGLLRRPTMLMSKNGMTNVWSWDHCFNAMALAADAPAAIDQFLTVFDQQRDDGALPDYVNDAHAAWSFVKPPVHGWALSWLLDHADVSRQQVEACYEPLRRWTRWWLTARDPHGDGVPHYEHGNDSGWDNSTAFRDGVPFQSPDLPAYLVLQLDCLARLARLLGRDDEADRWTADADAMLDRLMRGCFADGRFGVRRADTGELYHPDTLLRFMPLVLGERLPRPVADSVVGELVTAGYLTGHGLATELPTSPCYEADGYWRGPIWAPSTLIVVDGLRRAGHAPLAAEIARRFCDMVAGSDMAENYDARTGRGLRDSAYTWTASVFLVLAAHYL